MTKGKDIRIIVIFKCTSCVRKGVNKELPVISKYITQKNRHNTPNQLELRKLGHYYQKYMTHEGNKEIDGIECMCDFSKEWKV